MSETQTVPVIEQPPKVVNSKNQKEVEQKKKQKNLKHGRKRSKSFTGGGGIGKIKNMRPVLPSRFLLGGNIRDPLNLNSLQDEEVNRAMNAVTPKSSPVPTPPSRKGQVPVIIPRNMKDPLNLDCEDDAEYEMQFCSLTKRCRKKRIRKKRTSSGTSEAADAENSGCVEAKTPETQNDAAKIPEIVETKDLTLDLDQIKEKNKRKSEEQHKDPVKKMRHFSMDKIVSPVVPQPGSWMLKRNNSRKDISHRGLNRNQNANQVMPAFKEKFKQFQYGNYNRYYGYRNQHSEVDLRLLCFSQHRELFVGKDILDIGCNIGHITLSVARDFGAKSVVGIDIDDKLVTIARKNIKHYVKTTETPPRSNDNIQGEQENKSSEFFPISMPILYGPIEIPGFSKERSTRQFPNNVTFKHGNYVLDDDLLLSIEQPQFDVILCLSVTKWIHLNWGDTGIKQAFRRMYAQLRPGGKLILEPQNWASYKSKKKLTETIYKHFNTIEFFPEKFTEYLLSIEVGFAKSEILSFSQHHSKGFQRPIQVYTKSNLISSEYSENSNTLVTVQATTKHVESICEKNSLEESVCETDKLKNCSNKITSDSGEITTDCI